MLGRTNFDQGQTVDELKLDMSDEELMKLIKTWRSIAGKFEKIIKTDGRENRNFYIGKDEEAGEIANDRSRVQDNRIFTNIETVVPLVTSKPAQPVVFLRSQVGMTKKDKEAVKEQAIKNQKILLAITAEQKLQKQFEKMVRQHQIYKIGIVKYGMKDGKIFANVILPTRALLDSEATSIEDSEFIGEKVVLTAKIAIGKYPDHEKFILAEVQGKKGTKITIEEWWTDDFMVISYKNKILEKKKNPLFSFEDVKDTEIDEFGKEIQKTTKKNLFNRPRKPYVLFNVYNLGESIIDDVTALELSKVLQIDINKGKRQIADNADKVGNPIRTGKGFTEEQLGQINAELAAGDTVYLGEDQELAYIQALPLPSYVLNRIQDSRNAIDNIFGIHSTTRGERDAQETLGGREILRGGDEDRQATIGRAIESVYEELYEAFAHLVKLFYDDAQLVPILGNGDTDEYLEFKGDDIADGMKIRVRPGSTVPDDKISLRTQALQLAKLGLLPKKKLYEELGFDDAEELAREVDEEVANAQVIQDEILAKTAQKGQNEQDVKQFADQISNIS